MPDAETQSTLSSEDRKLVTLARSTRARAGAAEGAALRDGDGRTYAGATVDLPSLRLSALQVCIAMAVASGSTALEAAVLLGESAAPAPEDRGALRELNGADVPLLVGDARGQGVHPA